MSSERLDPYGVLGVTRTASPAQISHAYRALLYIHHPDTRIPNPRPPETRDADADAERKHDLALRQVLAAYAVLHDPQRRAEYDRRRRSAVQPGYSAAATPPIVVLGDIARSKWPRPIWIAPVNPSPVAPASITTLVAVLRAHTDAQLYRGR
jgi:curved DNA-binding protein CbpA